MLNSSDYHHESDSRDGMYQRGSITSTTGRQHFLKCIWDLEANNFKPLILVSIYFVT